MAWEEDVLQKWGQTTPSPQSLNGKYILDESNCQEDDGDGQGEDEILAHHFDLLQSDGSKRLMIFVDSFFDESGTHAGSKFVAVAGFAGFSFDWLPFSIDWGLRLAAYPAIEYFHSVEANNRIEQFEGWSRADRDEKVISLIEVIKDSRPQPLISSVKISDYETLLAEFPDCMPDDPYIFCIYNILLECFNLGKGISKKANDRVQISLNFEKNDAMERQVREAYRRAREEYPALDEILAPTISFLPKKAYRPLQAADALAYDCNKEFTKKDEDPDAPMRPSLHAILSKVPRYGFHWPWDYKSLQGLFAKRYGANISNEENE